ncbi:hypothetical protein Trydic_g2627 [Trypoxylus dichotomus]
MGHHGFGNLYKLRGIVTYSLSPFEQRAFPKFFSHAVPNTIRRITESIPYVVPPFALGYGLYVILEQRHDKVIRKDPREYENDV